jgi:GntR family transcriptional regulator
MSRPMYRVIAEDLREQIETGALEPGAQLPTETELRKTYGASRNTIRDAIKWLTQLGLTETRPGQGTFVIRKIEPLINAIGPYLPGEVAGPLAEVASGRREAFSPPQIEIQEADHLVASELLLPERAEVISRHDRRYVDSAPWSMQTAFYPMVFAVQGAERLRMARDIETGTLSYLFDTLHVRMETWRARLTAHSANQNESDFFRLRPGSFVVEIFHTYYEQSGRPFCCLVTVYPADRNLFQVTAGSVPSLGELCLRPRPRRVAGTATCSPIATAVLAATCQRRSPLVRRRQAGFTAPAARSGVRKIAAQVSSTRRATTCSSSSNRRCSDARPWGFLPSLTNL